MKKDSNPEQFQENKTYSSHGLSKRDLLFNLPSAPDFIKENLQMVFIEDDKYLPIRKLIDKEFNTFFKKLISLSPLDLKKDKQKLLIVFYNIIYHRILLHDNLREIIDEMKAHRDELSKVELKTGLDNFKTIVNEVFEIPNIVLKAFELSAENFHKDIAQKSILEDYFRLHTNRKDKQWREQLYQLADNIYKEQNYMDKTKCLKAAFENLPDKENYRKEFDLKFKSIYDKYRQR
jgi:hypothetical protein